jgi:hypothetical protein
MVFLPGQPDRDREKPALIPGMVKTGAGTADGRVTGMQVCSPPDTEILPAPPQPAPITEVSRLSPGEQAGPPS